MTRKERPVLPLALVLRCVLNKRKKCEARNVPPTKSQAKNLQLAKFSPEKLRILEPRRGKCPQTPPSETKRLLRLRRQRRPYPPGSWCRFRATLFASSSSGRRMPPPSSRGGQRPRRTPAYNSKSRVGFSPKSQRGRIRYATKISPPALR